MAKKPISLEEFQEFSIKSFSKTKSHPKSPYDPITMKTHRVPLNSYQGQVTTPSADTNSQTKLVRNSKKKRKVDTTLFLGSDDENTSETTTETTMPAEETPPRPIVPKKTSTPRPCNHEAELKKANKSMFSIYISWTLIEHM